MVDLRHIGDGAVVAWPFVIVFVYGIHGEVWSKRTKMSRSMQEYAALEDEKTKWNQRN
jgi:hypothetical protein